MNHSENANLTFDSNGNNIAVKDIKQGDEITCNYKEFYEFDWFLETMTLGELAESGSLKFGNDW